VDIPEEMRDFRIPKLILQPIIENAVYHGLELKGEKGTIDIRALIKDDGMHIIITDDGVGIPAETLERLKNQMNSEDHVVEQDAWTRIALRNVHNRLRLMYGEGYGLEISSELNVGTTVEINFPV
jgi:two-component system sensor histidine kinase YesM